MRVIDFIKKKNKLVFDETGVILVPEDQIIDLVPRKLSMHTDSSMCPYCNEFLYDDRGECYDCPMNKAFNKCTGLDEAGNRQDNDSYAFSLEALDGKSVISIPGMSELVDRYNAENGFQDAKTIAEMGKEELLYFVEEYNNYVVDFPEHHDSESYPVCIYEFFENEFQDILEDEEQNKEESI